jgi:ribosomal protein S18 acetylase RimI-like enzyme
VKETAYPDQEWDDWAAGAEPVGIVGACRDDDSSRYHVIAMWVTPEYCGRGLGRRLLNSIEEWISTAGGAAIHLEVADTATGAASLYERAGYSLDGQQSPSPHTPGITHLSMRKRLA